MTVGNLELLNKTMEFIKANPEQHDQGNWISHEGTCGTTMCFAGHAAALSGAQVPEEYEPWRINPETGQLDLYGEFVSDYAAKVLDVSADEESFIFMCMDEGDLENRVKFVAEAWEKGKRANIYNYPGMDEDCSCGCCD